MKWDLPWADKYRPPWLDPAAEIPYSAPSVPEDPKARTLYRGRAVASAVDALLRIGAPLAGAFGVCANAVNESGWFEHYCANNLGGWKITRTSAEAIRARTGRPAPWWKAPGNRGSGDPPWCFYRAFPSLDEFFREWCETFVPRIANGGRYTSCGQAFWSGRDWFPLLCAAGYKGPVTQKNPGPSIAEHASLVRSVQTRWAQAQLGLEPDGAWGPRSIAACKAWQERHGIQATGQLSSETLDSLAQH